MQNTADHAVKVLNSLIETTLDSAHGYKEAAENADNPRFKTLFTERAGRRQALTLRLQDEVRSFGGEPQDHQTILGKAHNTFVDIKAALTGNDDKAVINEVERGEDFIRDKFEHAAKEGDLPPTARQLIEKAYSEIKADHDEVSRLKKQMN
jgi:uncharacterized protein (TIGR02284 family)